jgi:hypothetical protein
LAKTATITLEYQNVIPHAPVGNAQLLQQASTNDGSTVAYWRDQWIGQTKANKEFVGSFKEHSIGSLHGAHQYMPAIIVGSGPSLAGNVEQLRERGKIPLLSCLHNFHFLEDNGVKADYYVSLDAGPITVTEVSEGGKLSAEEYWERTKDHTLLAYIGSHPDLIKKWRGKILFFNCPIPDQGVRDEIDKIERFNACIGTGGNVLGACLYIAKGILGCHDVAFVGADFCFSYDNKFHGWNSSYDANMGQCIPLTDVYGIKRKTWQSYANFKSWFDWVSTAVPGNYYNCSEGGCLGSYPEGNIASFKYMDLATFLDHMHMNNHTKAHFENPEINNVTMLF